jgi:tetratricopeptide (TPR) repeat protein
MTPTEIGPLDIIEKEADYQLYLSQGDQETKRGDYSAALELYLKAQAKRNTSEISDKIVTTRATLYAQYLKYGDNDFSSGYYVEAAKHYIRAEVYANDLSELNARKPRVLEKLITLGKDHASLGKHKEAVEVFDLALKMGSSEEARRLREVSYNYVEYDYWMKKANDILQTGNTGDAETAVEGALRYRKTDEATRLLGKIQAYHKYCKNADSWLKNGNVVYAEAQVESARNEIPSGGWGIRLKAKISDYRAYIKNAEDYLQKNDLVKAKEQIGAAANICSTEEVKKLKVKAGM